MDNDQPIIIGEPQIQFKEKKQNALPGAIGDHYDQEALALMEDYRYKKNAISCLIWTEWTCIVFFILINFIVLMSYFRLIGSDEAIEKSNVMREEKG